MTVRGSLARTVLFAAAYALATTAGRMTVIDGTTLSMVWPAAGVLVLWFCAPRGLRTRWVDVVALVVITFVVNLATGTGGRLAVIFVVANVSQISLFLWLFRNPRAARNSPASGTCGSSSAPPWPAPAWEP